MAADFTDCVRGCAPQSAVSKNSQAPIRSPERLLQRTDRGLSWAHLFDPLQGVPYSRFKEIKSPEAH
jgi:hypothetical protein